MLTLDKLAPDIPATLIGIDSPSMPGGGVAAGEVDVARRLAELGFVEGERVRVIRRSFPFGDPIAVRVGTLTIALRKFEAAMVTVRPD